jgi:threonine/homoserine/homoserine lactone efflux protein/transposase-like protein
MLATWFWSGLAIGLAISVPPGPALMICVRRALMRGMKPGLTTTLGVGLGDAIFAGIAAFGVQLVSGLLSSHEGLFKLLGGLLLCYLGYLPFKNRHDLDDDSITKYDSEKLKKDSLLESFSAGLLFSLANPLALLPYAAVTAGLGGEDAGFSFIKEILFALGSFLGAVGWYGMIVVLVQRSLGKLNFSYLRWIDRGTGVLIFVFGLLTFKSLVPESIDLTLILASYLGLTLIYWSIVFIWFKQPRVNSFNKNNQELSASLPVPAGGSGNGNVAPTNQSNISPRQKALVILELLSGIKSPNDICHEFQIGLELLNSWRREFLKNAHRAFQNPNQNALDKAQIAELENLVDELKRELEIARSASNRLSSIIEGQKKHVYNGYSTSIDR